jgi:hypothetical protein
MPWNKTRGSRRNGGAPHQPRDLDELLKRSKDKFKRAMPRGPGQSGPVVFTAGPVPLAQSVAKGRREMTVGA